MRRYPWRRARLSRAAFVLCVVIVAAGAVAASWPAGQRAAAQPSLRCGAAYTHVVGSDTQFFRADHGALTCFAAAARMCRPAALRVTAMGVDTGIDYVFTVAPARTSCLVIERSQSYSANFGGSRGPVTTTVCRRLPETTPGVRLSCGGQGVSIPATVRAPAF